MSTIPTQTQDTIDRLEAATKAMAELVTALKRQRDVSVGNPAALIREQIITEMMSTPALFTGWLHRECELANQPLDSGRAARHVATINVAQLMAFMAAAPTQEARNAALEHIRAAFVTAHLQAINQRVQDELAR